MRSDKDKGLCRARRSGKIVTLIIAMALLTILLAQSVLAVPIGNRISDMLGDYAESEDPSFIDLFLFGVIFIAICYIAFNAVFKDAKYAVIALSASLGIGLSIGLVYGGHFTFKKLLPFSVAILFIVLCAAIFVFLTKFVFKSGSVAHKVIAFILAAAISAALIFMMIYFVCGDDRCEDNPILRRMFGSDSMFGDLSEWLGSLVEGGEGEDAAAAATAAEREAAVETPAPPPTACTSTITRAWGLLASESTSGCEGDLICRQGECVEQTGPGWVLDQAGMQWPLIVFIILALLAFLKHKKLVKAGYWTINRLRRPWMLRKFRQHLEDLRIKEHTVITGFNKLHEAVEKEKTEYDPARHIINRIVTDIQDTIGGERKFVDSTDIEPRIDKLHGFNLTEWSLIKGILTAINDEKSTISGINKDMKDELDALENIDEHYMHHTELMDKFKQFNFKEKDTITNMEEQLKQNIKDFENLKTTCKSMAAGLRQIKFRHLRPVQRLRHVNYADILKHIRAVRDESIRLHRLFTYKLQMMNYLAVKLKELKEKVQKLHDAELANTKEFLEQAEERLASKKYDSAVYLATHVLETAEYLEHSETSEEAKKEIETMSDRAVQIIKESLPQVFESMSEKIKDELAAGNYTRLARFADNVGSFKLVSKKYNKKLYPQINDFNTKLETLKTLVKDIRAGRAVRLSMLRDLGLI